ncbi:MAG TPA: hypothetical protein VGB85_31835 [Nannocystis sp.]|jgi:hypothetical protein
MTLVAVYFALALAPPEPAGPAEPWREHEAACQTLAAAAASAKQGVALAYAAAADQCRKAFETAASLASRSVFAFDAHRLYRRAHEAGHTDAICTDARMLKTFAAQLAAPGAENRPHDRKDVDTLLSDLAPELVACSEPAESARPEPTTAVVPPASMGRTGRADEMPRRSGPVSRPDRRPLRIAGGVALGLGLGLGGAMIGALVQGASLRTQADAVNGEPGQTIGDGNDFASIRARGERADHMAIGFGVAAGALTVAGAALLVIDVRRKRAGGRLSLQPSILPTAGIRLRLEF